MSDAKHTPGPWRIAYEHGSMHIKTEYNESLMCDETYYPWVPDNIADWNLIAAAPDMLEALLALMDLNDNHGPFGGEMYQDRIDRAWTRARAAIAKAEGRE